jgi:hypothetical protein
MPSRRVELRVSAMLRPPFVRVLDVIMKKKRVLLWISLGVVILMAALVVTVPASLFRSKLNNLPDLSTGTHVKSELGEPFMNRAATGEYSFWDRRLCRPIRKALERLNL